MLYCRLSLLKTWLTLTSKTLKDIKKVLYTVETSTNILYKNCYPQT